MKKLFYAISMLLIASCSESSPADLSVINMNTSELSKLAFNDLYEVKKVIPLETSEESLLGAYIGISYVNDQIYIRTGAHLMSCNEYVVFNNKVWISSINRENMVLSIVNPSGTYYASVNRADNQVEFFNKASFTDKQNPLPISLIPSGEEDLISLVTYKGLQSVSMTDTTSIGYKLKQSMTENSNPVIVLYNKTLTTSIGYQRFAHFFDLAELS